MFEVRNSPLALLNEHITATDYSGSCFFKDVQTLTHTARDHGQILSMPEKIEVLSNELFNKVIAKFRCILEGKIFAPCSLAFKFKTYPGYSAR